MKILFCGLKYEYGVPTRGLSFEYYNFYDTLFKMENGKHSVLHFPFDVYYRELGQKGMNRKLLEYIENFKPDLVFFFLFNDEFLKEVLLHIKNDLKITTFNWFADDHWRFYNFSRFWAPYFSFVSTTDQNAIRKYHKYGIYNVIQTQWGFNHFLYQIPSDFDFDNIKYKYELTFVGQNHSNRAKFVEHLKINGIKISCFGRGWETGRITFDEMLNVFRSSRINLNFSRASGGFKLRSLASLFLTRRCDQKIRFQNLLRLPQNISATIHRFGKQIKGRIFEIPGSGGFLLTENVENISDYFLPEKEISVFDSPDDLLAKVKYYLSNESLRKEIAYHGFKRAIREHTYEQRFIDIFKKIGLYNMEDK